MEIKNPGFAFNKVVFKRLDNKEQYKNDTKNLHESLFKLSLDDCTSDLLDLSKDFEGDERTFMTLDLIVSWPGILMGLGLGHGAKTDAKEKDHPHMTEVKNGFYFDFTTGLPVITGSMVKGILRSLFPGRYKNKDQRQAVEKRILSILNDIKKKDWGGKQIEILEDILFEGKIDKDGKKAFLSSTESDIFLEAIPSSGATANYLNGNISEKRVGLFLGEDTLTPHAHPLKNPIPIKILKVLPGVTFKFQFLLNNEGGLDASEKLKLFKHLLKNYGAGARKGVGFGQFVDIEIPIVEGNNYISFDSLPQKDWGTSGQGGSSGGKEEQTQTTDKKPTTLEDYKGKIKKDIKLIGKVIDKENSIVAVSILGKVEEFKLTGGTCPDKDNYVIVSMNTTGTKDKLRIENLRLIKIYKND